MRKVKVGFLGLGNVGAGAYAIIQKNNHLFEHRDKLSIEVVKALVRNPAKNRGDVPEAVITTNPDDVLNNPEIELVAEFLGGVEPARTYILRALNNKKTVITANKVVLATCWHELEECARENGVGIYFEASVAGGIPIIRTIQESMQANSVENVMGIINGTTNFILSSMTTGGLTYAEALSRAQAAGLAEPDPTLDVEGMDAAYKLSILASLCFHAKVPVEAVYREGITKVTPRDIEMGRRLGLVIKLLAIGKREGNRLEVRVHPTFIPVAHPLANINGATNAVYLTGDAVGEVVLSGQGAGGLPTGSAVVSDIIYAAKQEKHRLSTFKNTKEASKEVSFNYDWVTEYYVSLLAPDKPGVLAKIAAVFAKFNVSISSMMQLNEGADNVPLVFLVHRCHELYFRQAITEIEAIEGIVVESTVRVENA